MDSFCYRSPGMALYGSGGGCYICDSWTGVCTCLMVQVEKLMDYQVALVQMDGIWKEIVNWGLLTGFYWNRCFFAWDSLF